MSQTTDKSMNSHRLNFPSRIKVKEDFFLERFRNLSEEYLALNSHWAEYVYSTKRYEYIVDNPENQSEPVSLELITNYNLSQSENELKGKIDPQTIQQFVQRMNAPKETTMDFEFTPISEISKLQQTRTIEVEIPPQLDLIGCRYLKVSLGSLYIDNNGQLNEIVEAQGVLFLYDNHEETIASEPVYFNHIFGKTIFDQTNLQVAYLERRKPNEVLSLVCILMSQNAYPLEEFFTYLRTPKQDQLNDQLNDLKPTSKELPKMPIPFALSYINLSNVKSSEIKFPNYWIKYKSSEVLNLIGKTNFSNEEDSDNSTSETNSTRQKSSETGNSSTNSSEQPEADVASILNSPYSSNHSTSTETQNSSGSGFNSINMLLLNNDQYVNIKFESSITMIDNPEEIQKVEFCISSDPKRGSLPMLAESVPHPAGLTPMDISLSNIKLEFNSAKKADFVYFKAYFCEEEQEDPLKPSFMGQGKFVSKKYNEEYQSVFISSPVPYSKTVYFSDFVKIYVPNPLKYSTHIIIHIFLVQKGCHSLCRLAIIRLFDNYSPELNMPLGSSANTSSNTNSISNLNGTSATSTNESFSTSNMPGSAPTNSNFIPMNSTGPVIFNSSPTANSDLSVPLPSSSKPTPLQSSTITIPTMNPSQLKMPDYLQKYRPCSKTTLTLTIEIPSILFPPKIISEFASVDSPEKINIDEISSLDEKVIQNNFIPITAKFFTLMSPLTAEYFIKFYTNSITNNIEIKEQLRSWIYHNFDVKTIKTDFLTAFTSSFEKIIQEEIANPESNFLKMIIDAIDIITDIFWVSCLRKTEEEVPESVHNFLSSISDTIIYFVKKGKQQEYINLSDSYGRLLFFFGSFSEKDTTSERAIFSHLKKLLSLDKEYQIDSLIAFFEFMIQFTFSTNLAHQMIIQMPVKALSTVLYSPYQSLLSFLNLAFYRSLQLDDRKLHEVSCLFVARICFPLENSEEISMIYRSGFTFSSFLSTISNFYEDYINYDSKFEIIPAILFLITYTPSQLLKNYFNVIGNEFQVRFINFMKKSAEIVIKKIEKETLNNKELEKSFYGIILFKELTQRFLQFLRYNFTSLEYCLPSVVSLLDLLINAPYQTPRNYPKLFDFVQLLISSYQPSTRALFKCLLKAVTSPQHIARCFGTTLIAYFFNSEFNNRKNVNTPLIEFVDSFATSIVHVSSSKIKINLYKQMIALIQRLISDVFKNDGLIQSINPKLSQAFQLAEMFEKIESSNEPDPDLCIFVMKIADANKNFPSMRMKWLKKIVQINTSNNWYNAAFVAQLHICALISTVVLNKEKIEYFSKLGQNANNVFFNHNINNKAKEDEDDEIIDFGAPIVRSFAQNTCFAVSNQSSQNDETPFNLILTRPFLNSSNYVFSETEFKFIPSVLVETTIDFDSLHPDFYTLLNNFNIDLFKKNLREAIKIGLKAKVYYEVRCLLSILLRIAVAENDGATIEKVLYLLKQCYSGVLSNVTSVNGCPFSFFVKDNFIYCLEAGQTLDGGIPVNRVDKDSGEIEKTHCFSIYRTKFTENDLENFYSWKRNLAENSDNESNKEFMIQMTQYTTTNALPRYTIKSEIIDYKTVSISLISYARMEEKSIIDSIDKTSSEFERCFPILGNSENDQSEIKITPNTESDLEKIYSMIYSILDGKLSFFNILKLIAENFSPSTGLEMANNLRSKIERLVKVFHAFVDTLQSLDVNNKFLEIVNLVNSFTSAFQLNDIDITSYNGSRNPLSNVIGYDVF